MMSGPKRDIPLLVVGCDFRNTAAGFRGKLMTTAQERSALYQGICCQDACTGFAVLETCNRIEWLVSTEHREWLAGLLTAQMLRRWQQAFPAAGSYPAPYVHTGRDAARHLLRVVAGLESLAAGEAQIAGQFQDALRRSREEGTSSAILNGMGAAAGRLAKAGYKIGFRSDHRRGIHGMAADLLRAYFNGELCDRTCLVLGMGAIGRKTAELLNTHSGLRTVRFNRTVEDQHVNEWHRLDELPEMLKAADALVVATGSLTPVLQAQHLDAAGRDRPLLIIDIGIPRQVSEEAADLRGIDYRSLDDLIDCQHDDLSQQSVVEMEQEIDKEVRRFKRYCIERSVVNLLEETQRQRQEFIQQLIPSIVKRELGELDDRMRRRVEATMKQLISDYANDSFNTIHNTLEDQWSSK